MENNMGGLSGFFADLQRLYPDLDAGFLRSIASEFEQVLVAGGQTLVRHGDPSDALYVVMSGRLVATRKDQHGEFARIGEIGRGEMIGEMSLLSGGMRTATVTALRDSRLVRISNETFLEFMHRHPSVTRQFIQILTRRLLRQAPANHEKLSTLALVPICAPRRAAAFGVELEAALRQLGSVLRVDRSAIEAHFPGVLARVDRDDGIAAWLDEQERGHSMLVYVCDATPNAWTRLCLRQADRVLVVADAQDQAVPPGEVEQLLYAHNEVELRGSELVLLQAAAASGPLGTAQWLAPRRVRRHHHVRAGDHLAMARLCRHLSGRSTGLALGGGGAKAFAEVGVLRACAQAGIEIDVLGGTSMGAVVGALAAQGQDAKAIHALLRGMLKIKPFSGLTLPVVSLLSDKRLTRAMESLFGATEIEDLWRRYFCVVCNLTHGTVKAVQHGRLSRWVQASNAVPGIMPPVVESGELYVDGGLLNNVPADLMSQLNAGPVIAVNVSSVTTLHAGNPDQAHPLGWQALLQALTPGRRPASRSAPSPRLGRLMVRAMLLASSNHAATMRNYSSLYLTPPLDGVDVSDWHAIDALVETGYAHASKALETWNRGQTAP